MTAPDGDNNRLHAVFWTCVMDGMYGVFKEIPSTWDGPDARFYRHEKQIIKKHIDPFYWGFVVTTCFFASFRFSRSKLLTNWWRGQNAQVVSLENSSLTRGSPKAWVGYLEQRSQAKSQQMTELYDIPFDIMVSVLCGISTTLFLSQPTQLKNDFINAPLVPGKSVAYSRLCPKFEVELAELARSGKVGDVGKDSIARTFVSFVQNCRLRKSYIEANRDNDSNLSDVIPYPGLRGISR